ncbi:zona pellucida sperm-binding protein 3-like [Arapaima gigas]
MPHDQLLVQTRQQPSDRETEGGPVALVPRDQPVSLTHHHQSSAQEPQDSPVVPTPKDQPIVLSSQQQLFSLASQDGSVVLMPQDHPLVQTHHQQPTPSPQEPEDTPMVLMPQDQSVLLTHQQPTPSAQELQESPMVSAPKDQPLALSSQQVSSTRASQDSPMVLMPQDQSSLVLTHQWQPSAQEPEDSPMVLMPQDQSVLLTHQQPTLSAQELQESPMASAPKDQPLVLSSQQLSSSRSSQDDPMVLMPQDQPLFLTPHWLLSAQELQQNQVALMSQDHPVVLTQQQSSLQEPQGTQMVLMPWDQQAVLTHQWQTPVQEAQDNPVALMPQQPSVQMHSIDPVVQPPQGHAVPRGLYDVSPAFPVLPSQPRVQAQKGQPVVLMPPGHPMVQEPQRSPELFRNPWPLRSVIAECWERSVLVAVQRDLLGTGHLIQPSEVTLGGCASSGQDATAYILFFETELHSCGSTMTMTNEALIYTFTLVYQPQEVGAAPIVRANSAAFNIECHYLRKHNVSSNALSPTWIPFQSTMSTEELLMFSLKLMTDDWQQERPSSVYMLGDIMNIEASVIVANHIPLRVFVDSCVATSLPDANAAPRYQFVENHGCLTDAKLTSSRSQFLPRRQEDKLQMQLDAFRLMQKMRDIVYITCILKVTTVAQAESSQHKACSFSTATNRWVAAGGRDQVCDCCNTNCSLRKMRDLANAGKAPPYLRRSLL